MRLIADAREGDAMKYMVSWIAKPGLGEADSERGLAVFAKWTPLPNGRVA